jgi:hypothetical protein
MKSVPEQPRGESGFGCRLLPFRNKENYFSGSERPRFSSRPETSKRVPREARGAAGLPRGRPGADVIKNFTAVIHEFS